MKKVIILGSLLISATIFGQLYIGGSSYIFNKGSMIYTKGNLELNGSSSNFYLRNEGHFLQGASGTSTNRGSGKLSVFQEGTVNNFAYNYWCSPVGIASSSAGNEPFGISLLYRPTTNIASTASTATSSLNGSTSSSTLDISSYWIHRFVVKDTYAEWDRCAAGTILNPGEGFTMKGTSGTDATNVGETATNNPGSRQRYDFRGKPNDGNISILVAPDQFTLTGNPYPSALDLSLFLSNETNSTGIAYFWEQDKSVNSHYLADYKGGYGAFSPVGQLDPVTGFPLTAGVYVPAVFYSYDGAGNEGNVFSNPNVNYQRRYCPVGQGFMISGSGSSPSTVTMRNSYRISVKEGTLGDTGSSYFEKKGPASIGRIPSPIAIEKIYSVAGNDYAKVSAKQVPQIRFNALLNNRGIRQLALVFVDHATDGVDHAMDAASPNDAPEEVYFVLNDSSFVIDARPFSRDKKIPIGFSNEQKANFKITVKEMMNFDQVDDVYLHDKISNEYHDIKNSFFELNLPAGKNNTQYEIVFQSATTLGLEKSFASDLVVLQDNASKNLIIENPKQKELNSYIIYDVVGKRITTNTQLGNKLKYMHSTANLPDGIYILKVMTADRREQGVKFIVKN
ncbi:T9SS type A sorting domain-containing protein [Flavobacterium nackdongense]|uniref:T9SS type A sorting domain-containing protein n=1 Tax=Flavobacterium nackdongense TaxID=2547394 RepID=A0A4P6Y6A7_9FLAO|nr:T9SS type A sorting domain-containing protein [Flavobacterium nackdongense]QBN17869.1 T9SS type A sorting domain-containing protein [Flavobacterium nackdongense]